MKKQKGKINKRCRVCQSRKLIRFFDLGRQPFANSLLPSSKQKERKYPLSLSWCANCNLVQLDYTADPEELFSDYVWVTGTAQTTKKFADIFCRKMIMRAGRRKKGYVLEVASNDGTFLQPFLKKGYKVLGIDPARNICRMAKRSGIATLCDFFGVKTAQKVLKNYGPAQIVFARNVLPHVAGTRDFVDGLSKILHDDGTLAIEVHYAKVIQRELHYDSIYHEHLCYFTLKTLEKLLNEFGLFVFDIMESPISGGSIVVYAAKYRRPEKPIVRHYRKEEKGTKLNTLMAWRNFAKQSVDHRKKLLDALDKIKRRGGKVVGYGASARSSTLLNFCGIDNRLISVIADQNVLKQGKFTAGTHIIIKSPKEAMATKPDYVFILAWNFSKEIRKILKNKFSFRGKCIIPLPGNPRIL